MIGRLAGRVVELSPGEVVLDVAGVGYVLSIPLRTFYALSESRGGAATVHVHTHVREDALVLFGFHEPGERDMFRHLIAVGGVGPRVALAVLSGIEPSGLRAAVAERDRERLQRIPGVGKKTAERILLELGDRLHRAEREEDTATTRGRHDGAARSPGARVRVEAVSALVNLGYAAAIAERAVAEAVDAQDDPTTPSLEGVLRDALRRLVR